MFPQRMVHSYIHAITCDDDADDAKLVSGICFGNIQVYVYVRAVTCGDDDNDANRLRHGHEVVAFDD